jgi:hypothetical protein
MGSIDSGIGRAPLWLAGLALLVAVIGWETDWGRHLTPDREAPAATSAPVKVALLPEYALPGNAEALRETVERPAFVPTRRQAPAALPAEAAKPQMKRGQFVLTGTAVVDQQAIAFLREAATGKARSVRKGDTINGLVVSEVTPDRVVLSLGGETEPLPLKVAAGPRTTIQAAAPVPGAAPAPAPAPAALPRAPRATPAASAPVADLAQPVRPGPVSPVASPGPAPAAAATPPAAGGMTFEEMYRRRYQNQRQPQ